MIKYECDNCKKVVGENIAFITKWIGRENHFCSPECAHDYMIDNFSYCENEEKLMPHLSKECHGKEHHCLYCKYDSLSVNDYPCFKCNGEVCYFEGSDKSGK